MEDYERTRRTLMAILARMSVPVNWQEDFLQEALLHYLRMENQFPSNTHSWKITSCEHFLWHLIRKHRGWAAHEVPQSGPAGTEDSEAEPPSEASDPRADVVVRVCAREEFARLMAILKPVDRVILRCLNEGLLDSEISLRINLSHQAVARHRKRIESAAVRLGIPPPESVAA